MIKKYEYKVIKAGDMIATRSYNFDKCTEISNQYGKVGWELVSTNYHWITTQYTLFFKRELESE
jgi:hypothetical protein